jgi:hypothetical protein
MIQLQVSGARGVLKIDLSPELRQLLREGWKIESIGPPKR